MDTNPQTNNNTLSKDEVEVDGRLLNLYQQAATVSRAMLSSRLGFQFNGNRDLYSTFGYVHEPQYQDYRNLYDRQGLATRAVEKFANDTWNMPAILIDGDSRSDNMEKSTSKFIKDWVDLTERLKIWQILRQADVMCGFSRYSVLFMGAPGDTFSDPAGNNGLFYLSAFDENQAGINKYVEDMKSPNYGMPEFYTINFNSPEDSIALPNMGGSNVHYSRTVHIAENKLGSRIMGRPRLKTIINRLFDLEKVTGGGAEAAWLAVFKGMLFTAKDGAELPARGSQEATYLDEQINNLMHRVQRYATLADVDVHDLGVQEVNISNIFGVLTDDLCGSLGIPKRILFGSERGELASSQDKVEWNGVIMSRRTNFAEPEILRPFVKWCIDHKVIAPPTSKKFQVEWHDVYPLTKTEKAEYSLKLAQGAAAVTGGVAEMAYDVNEWRSDNDLPPLTEEEIKELEDKQDQQKGATGAQGVPGATEEDTGDGNDGGEPGGDGEEDGGSAPPLLGAEEDEEPIKVPVKKNPSIRNRLAGFLNNLARALFPNKFEGHRGRPGLVGGSLPRSAGTQTTGAKKGVGDRYDEIASQVADDMNFDKKKYLFYKDFGKEMVVEGVHFTTVGEFYPETGEVAVYGAQYMPEGRLKGVLAHEITHSKFNKFGNSIGKEDWANKINRVYIEDGDNWSTLYQTDGVTNYSQSYWKKAYKERGDKSFTSAIDETLAEISRLEMEGDDLKNVHPLWKEFYFDIKKVK